MTTGDKIKRLRSELGLTQVQLARAVDASQEAISKIERGKAKDTRLLVKIARELRTTAEFLSGDGCVREDPCLFDRFGEKTNTEYLPDSSLVPVLEWDELQEKVANVVEGKQRKIWQHLDRDAFPCPVKHSKSTFALRVKGSAMVSLYAGKSYYPGSIIFVDPEQAHSVKSGNRVVARLDSGDVVFKTYIEDAGRSFLKSENPQYPIIEDHFTIIGKVIGTWLPES